MTKKLYFIIHPRGFHYVALLDAKGLKELTPYGIDPANNPTCRLFSPEIWQREKTQINEYSEPLN